MSCLEVSEWVGQKKRDYLLFVGPTRLLLRNMWVEWARWAESNVAYLHTPHNSVPFPLDWRRRETFIVCLRAVKVIKVARIHCHKYVCVHNRSVAKYKEESMMILLGLFEEKEGTNFMTRLSTEPTFSSTIHLSKDENQFPMDINWHPKRCSRPVYTFVIVYK